MRKATVAVPFTLFVLVVSSIILRSRSIKHASHVEPPIAVRSAPGAKTATHPGIRANKQRLVADYSRLPLHFEANAGQTDRRVKFLSRGNGYGLFLTPTEAVLVLRKPRTKAQSKSPLKTRVLTPPVPTASVLRLTLLGARSAPQVRGLDELPGKSNYFIGNDPSKWRTNVPNYAKVKFHNVYSGVDLVYYGNQQQLEEDFVIAPGADPGEITLATVGAKKTSTDARGDLVLACAGGDVRLDKPIIFQEVRGRRHEIAGGYRFEGKNRVGFAVAHYDPRLPLVIDPVVAYSTYLGGSKYDYASGIAVDSSENVYVTGTTASSDFPGTSSSSIQHSIAGYLNAFVAKMNASGSALVYSTYLGGSFLDFGNSIAVDSSGEAYVTGDTLSTDFPVAGSSPIQSTFRGSNRDGFVTKLNAQGNGLVYSTYLGGSGDQVAYGIAVDASDNAYVTGLTSSIDFPGTSSSRLQSTLRGGYDAFVTALNATGTSLLYSTYLGGSGTDEGYAIAVDSSGNAYVTGWTSSNDFPEADSSTIQASLAGEYDAFVAKVNPAGTSIVYSTYLGGSAGEIASAITVDPSGNAYVAGETDSTDFPGVSSNSIQSSNHGAQDAFVVELNSDASALVFSTYLGGSKDDGAGGIAVGLSGNVYVAGYTDSADFPTVGSSLIQSAAGGGGDGFLAELDPTGGTIAFSTYLGGTGSDSANHVAMDSSGDVYVAGYTDSGDFPGVSSTSLQPAYSGGGDAFLLKLAATPQDQISSLQAAVDVLASADWLNQGQDNSLLKQLSIAMRSLSEGKTAAAISQLQDFISEVQSLMNDGTLSQEQGQPMIDAANALIHSLGG